MLILGGVIVFPKRPLNKKLDFGTASDREFPLILGEHKTSPQLLKVSPKSNQSPLMVGRRVCQKSAFLGLEKSTLKWKTQQIWHFLLISHTFSQDETISRNGSGRKKSHWKR